MQPNYCVFCPLSCSVNRPCSRCCNMPLALLWTSAPVHFPSHTHTKTTILLISSLCALSIATARLLALFAGLLLNMAPKIAHVSLFPNSVLDVELWERFMEDPEITANCPPPVNVSPAMAASKSSGSKPSVHLSVSDQQQAVG